VHTRSIPQIWPQRLRRSPSVRATSGGVQNPAARLLFFFILVSMAACGSTDVGFDLMLDSGFATPLDAEPKPEDIGVSDVGFEDTGTATVTPDGGIADTGTATVTPDGGFGDTGTTTVTPDGGPIVDDAGFAPDAVVPDVGFAPDAVVPDVGFAPDAVVPDVGFAPDAVVPDAGFAPDAIVIDAGTPDTGISPDSGVVSTRMSFFVTSRRVEVGGVAVTGGDLGGLAGADAFCLLLAREADSTDNRTWRAFLSASTVDARDRIGTGPWYNANNQLVATDAATLISNPPPETMILDEQGRAWNGGPSTRHDILTGSNHDGRKFGSFADMTSGHPNPNGSLFSFPDGSFSYPSPAFDFSCNDWTTNAGGFNSSNYAIVGHADWSNPAIGDEWMTSHVTACDETEMVANVGDIRVYCFATN
jgi:hypothetical protein